MDKHNAKDGTEICLFASFSEKSRFELEKETYDYDVVFVLTEGSFRFSMDKTKEKSARAGDVVMCPAGVCFERRAIETMTLYMIGFRSGSIRLPKGLLSLSKKDAARVADSCGRIGLDIVTGSIPPQSRMEHFCKDVLWVIDDCNAAQREGKYVRLEGAEIRGDGVHSREILKLVRLLSEQNPDENVSNKKLCAQLGISQVSLINKFRKATGRTPKQFAIALRMDRAKQLLLQNERTVSEIAHICGYDDALYFSRVFKKNLGISPTDFRLLGRV